MRLARPLAYFILASITLYSCFRPDSFPEEPRIEFKELEFKEVSGNFPDSLILTIDFQDGDGDIGLFEGEIIPPYHDYDFIVDSQDRFVTLNGDFTPPFARVIVIGSQDGRPVLLPTDENFSTTDNRPSSFDCQFYVVDSIHVFGSPDPPYNIRSFLDTCAVLDTRGFSCYIQDTIPQPNNAPLIQTRIDTFFIAKNEDNKNIFVDFFRKRGGEYEFIDWTRTFSEIGCGPDFNARFPVFAPDRNGKSLEGTIRYGMQSEGFRLVIRNDTFKVEVRILDRNLNVSNTVESPDLTLADIGG